MADPGICPPTTLGSRLQTSTCFARLHPVVFLEILQSSFSIISSPLMLLLFPRTHLTLGSVQMANPLFSVSCEPLLCKPCTFLHCIPSDIPGMMLKMILTIGLVSNVSLQGGERCTGRKGRRTATDTGWFNETQMHLRLNQFFLDKG